MGGGVVFSDEEPLVAPQQDVAAAGAAEPSLAVTITSTLDEYDCSRSSVTDNIVTVTARPEDAGQQRSPVNLVAVVDTSGSMRSEGKIDLVKSTLRLVVKNLGGNDRLSLVSYSDAVTVRSRLITMDAAGKQAAEEAIDALRVGGRTNLSGGLLQGVDIIQANSKAGEINSVLLLTDGHANVGISDPDELVAAMRSAAGPQPGFSLYTFGCGASHNAALLTSLADFTEGMYYFIEDADAIPESFGDCLGGLVSVVAQNTLLRLEALNGATIEEVQSRGVITVSKNKLNAEAPLGDPQCEESKDVLVRLRVPAVEAKAASEPTEYLHATVRYFDVRDKAFVDVSSSLALRRPKKVAKDLQPNEKVRQQVNRFKTTNALDRARTESDKGNFASARGVLKTAIGEVSMAGDLFSSKLVADMSECLEGMLDVDTYNSGGRYRVSSKQQMHEAQRCNGCDEMYTTPSKRSMKARFR